MVEFWCEPLHCFVVHFPNKIILLWFSAGEVSSSSGSSPAWPEHHLFPVWLCLPSSLAPSPGLKISRILPAFPPALITAVFQFELHHGRERWTSPNQWHSSKQQDLPVQVSAAGRVCSRKIQLGAALRQRPVSRIPRKHHWGLVFCLFVCFLRKTFSESTFRFFSEQLKKNLYQRQSYFCSLIDG